jgi:hypothetical protein
VARSLEEQLAWEGGNPCYGQAGRAVEDYLVWVSEWCIVVSLKRVHGLNGRLSRSCGKVHPAVQTINVFAQRVVG